MAVARAPRSRISSAAETTIRSRGLRITAPRTHELYMMLYIIRSPAKAQRSDATPSRREIAHSLVGNGRFCVAEGLVHPVGGSVVHLVVAAAGVLHDDRVARTE